MINIIGNRGTLHSHAGNCHIRDTSGRRTLHSDHYCVCRRNRRRAENHRRLIIAVIANMCAVVIGGVSLVD